MEKQAERQHSKNHPRWTEQRKWILKVEASLSDLRQYQVY